MRSRTILLSGMAALLLGHPAARAQDELLKPSPVPVQLLQVEKPRVSVTFMGDHGPVFLLGTLEQAPRGPLRITDTSGKTQDAEWRDVASLSKVTLPAEGFPIGTLTVEVMTEQSAAPGGFGGYGGGFAGVGRIPLGGAGLGGFGGGTVTQSGLWRLARLPEGNVVLRGEPYGSVTIPLSRVTDYRVVPLTGEVEQMPEGAVAIELLPQSRVQVPLKEIVFFRRDLGRGTVRVYLSDGQSFVGKLVELPKVAIALDTEKGRQSVPVETLLQFERSRPAAARF